MEGYYEKRCDELKAPCGRLHIEVTNLAEFAQLVNQAKEEADQLQKTINRLSNFQLEIEFKTEKSIFSES